MADRRAHDLRGKWMFTANGDGRRQTRLGPQAFGAGLRRGATSMRLRPRSRASTPPPGRASRAPRPGWVPAPRAPDGSAPRWQLGDSSHRWHVFVFSSPRFGPAAPRWPRAPRNGANWPQSALRRRPVSRIRDAASSEVCGNVVFFVASIYLFSGESFLCMVFGEFADCMKVCFAFRRFFISAQFATIFCYDESRFLLERFGAAAERQ